MQLNWITHTYDSRDGYGRMCQYLIRHLLQNDVQVVPVAQDTRRWDGWLQRLAGVDYSNITVTMTPGYNITSLPGRQWALSMYEATRIPDTWVENFNKYCERVLVPSQWCADTFAACGVTVPIHLIPGGTEPSDFPPLPLSKHRPYTFLALADRGARKGHDVVWSAFYEAFRDEPDVRLILKSRAHNNELLATASICDTRVSLWREDLRSLHDAFALVDCFVFPTRAEGFGMPPREAVMSGRPTICTQYSGCADADQWSIPVTTYQPQRATIEGGGEWMIADYQEVAAKMRWCYENRAQAHETALAGREWLMANQTYEHSARALLDLLRLHA